MEEGLAHALGQHLERMPHEHDTRDGNQLRGDETRIRVDPAQRVNQQETRDGEENRGNREDGEHDGEGAFAAGEAHACKRVSRRRARQYLANHHTAAKQRRVQKHATIRKRLQGGSIVRQGRSVG